MTIDNPEIYIVSVLFLNSGSQDSRLFTALSRKGWNPYKRMDQDSYDAYVMLKYFPDNKSKYKSLSFAKTVYQLAKIARRSSAYLGVWFKDSPLCDAKPIPESVAKIVEEAVGRGDRDLQLSDGEEYISDLSSNASRSTVWLIRKSDELYVRKSFRYDNKKEIQNEIDVRSSLDMDCIVKAEYQSESVLIMPYIKNEYNYNYSWCRFYDFKTACSCFKLLEKIYSNGVLIQDCNINSFIISGNDIKIVDYEDVTFKTVDDMELYNALLIEYDSGWKKYMGCDFQLFYLACKDPTKLKMVVLRRFLDVFVRRLPKVLFGWIATLFNYAIIIYSYINVFLLLRSYEREPKK